ncbi:glycosyl transferase family 2 [Escherichia coli]|nr:glycosyl transferase family 2 [Escherichia coli]
MLLIIADYPNEMNMREGAMQRIDAIDSLIRDRKRVYLNISFKKHLVRSNSSFNNVIVENLNAIIHRNIIKQYMQKSTTIYVHSVYNLLKVITLIDLKKTILDIHGVVPEELLADNKKLLSKVYNMVEKKGVLGCKKLIHVSTEMQKHYEAKYGVNLAERSIVLPIFEYKNITQSQNKWTENKIRSIYLGGLQTWQNIDKMIQICDDTVINNEAGKYEFNFFIPQSNLEGFIDKYSLKLHNINANASTLSRDEVIPFLKECHIGFVLRDDIIVNRVACPTKLVEYLECGVVPVVLSPLIGDFYSMGYQYITTEEMANRSISLLDLEKMAAHNLQILTSYQKRTYKAQKELVAQLC